MPPVRSTHERIAECLRAFTATINATTSPDDYFGTPNDVARVDDFAFLERDVQLASHLKRFYLIRSGEEREIERTSGSFDYQADFWVLGAQEFDGLEDPFEAKYPIRETIADELFCDFHTKLMDGPEGSENWRMCGLAENTEILFIDRTFRVDGYAVVIMQLLVKYSALKDRP
jgi:hypothetical protein